MAGEWREVSLSEVAEITSGKRPLVVSKEASFGCSVPVIGGGGPSGFTSHPLFDGGVLITGRVGTLGKLFAPDGPCWPSDNALVVRPRSDDTDSTYLRYAMQLVIAEAAAMNRGAANPLITQGDLGRLVVRHPPLPEQRAIAHILGTLDDKIELDRRMNETLEAMARAIFKSWFVDFDPVRARAEGRDSPLPPRLAALFPDRFEDSEMGEIPKGWGVGTVGDVAEVSSGKRPPVRYTEKSADVSIPLWGGNGPMAFVPEPLVTYPILLTGRVGTLGSVFRITTPCWPSDNTLILRTREMQAFEYLFFQLRQIDFASLNRGSTQPLLTQTDLKTQPLPLPSAKVLARFHAITENLFRRVDQASEESRTLAALRDALLPKLLSGELRVKDPERFIKRVA